MLFQATDPRLDLLAGAQPDPHASMAQRVAYLEKIVKLLLSGQLGRRVYTGTGPPTLQAPQGSLYVDVTPAAPKIYVSINPGAWRFVAVA